MSAASPFRTAVPRLTWQGASPEGGDIDCARAELDAPGCAEAAA